MLINTSRLKAIIPWLREAKYAWLLFVIIGGALFLSFRPHTSEFHIRLIGLVLQILGICTVIWGIGETRALFGHPSFTSKAKAWLGRFPLLNRGVFVAASNLAVTFSVGKARAYVTSGAGQNPSVENRLDAIEKNITSIHERIDQTYKEMDDEFRKVGEVLMQEKQSRQAEDNVIRDKLEATGTGGLHISAIGAACLFVGVVLSTLAPEIAKSQPIDIPLNPSAHVYFSPDGGATAAVVKAIGNAKSEILVQAYSFTSAPIAKALIDAHKRGVRVEIILDKSNRTSKYSSADFTAHAGIPTYIDAQHAIAHNKIMIVDRETVITGSFNFTKAAEEKNAENLIILKSKELAKVYIDNWNIHKGHSEVYRGR